MFHQSIVKHAKNLIQKEKRLIISTVIVFVFFLAGTSSGAFIYNVSAVKKTDVNPVTTKNCPINNKNGVKIRYTVKQYHSIKANAENGKLQGKISKKKISRIKKLKSADKAQCKQLKILYSLLNSKKIKKQNVKAKTPSGATCKSKMNYYLKNGAFSGKEKKSPGFISKISKNCNVKAHSKQMVKNFEAIESASKYFGYNPVGAVAVSSCESGFYHKAQNPSGARGLFQQMKGYWDGRLNKVQGYMKERGSKIKVKDNFLNEKSNSYVSIYMLSRNNGANEHWYPSKHCWNSSYSEVAGPRNTLSNWR